MSLRGDVMKSDLGKNKFYFGLRGYAIWIFPILNKFTIYHRCNMDRQGQGLIFGGITSGIQMAAIPQRTSLKKL